MKKTGDIIEVDLYDGTQGGKLFKNFFKLKITDKNIQEVELPTISTNVGYNIKEQKIVSYFFNNDGTISIGIHHLYDNTPLNNTEGIYFCQRIENNYDKKKNYNTIIKYC